MSYPFNAVRSRPRYGELRRPLALASALAVALSTPAWADPIAWRPDAPLALDRAWSDVRLQDAPSLDRAAQAALAREVGLDTFLPADPQSITAVGNCNDSGAGSLRQAVLDTASGGIVDLGGLACSTITLTSGQIEISQASLSLIGNGPQAITVANGNGTKYSNRVFNHTGGGSFIVEGMTVSGGIAAARTSEGDVEGGCIRSNGTVFLGNPFFSTIKAYGVDVTNCRAVAVSSGGYAGTAFGGGVAAAQVVVTNSRVSGCSLSGPGGGSGAGIFANTRLAMLNSEISGNTNPLGGKYASGGATGGYSSDTYDLILNSTIAGNTGTSGGGLAVRSAMVIRDSTISGNTATLSGGGIYASFLGGAHLSVFNSTITANVVTGDVGAGGLFASRAGFSTGTARLESTIIQGNFRAGTVPDDLSGSTAVFSGSNNLVGVAIPQLPELPPDTLIGVDPHLGPLANHGGPTRTHLLRNDSQAIGLGNNVANDDFDQRGRGFPRVVGSRADIGAVEFDPDRIFINGFD